MERTNPYAPPTARVADIEVPTSDAPFFTVGVVKLLLMSLCTMGLYDVYWFYMNWKIVKQREGLDVWPIPRAIFALFFCYQLFSRVRDFDAPGLALKELPAGPLAAGFIIVSLTWRLPDPWWLISMLAFVFLLPVQARINELSRAVEPQHDPNTRLSGWNWLAIILGGSLLILAVIGTFLPEE